MTILDDIIVSIINFLSRKLGLWVLYIYIGREGET